MTAPHVTDVQRRARLAWNHLLHPAARDDDPVRIADGLIALHSTDPATVHLSALARMRNPSRAAMDAALYEHRCLVRHHAMRSTLWVMSPAVAREAHASSTLALAPARWRTLARMVHDSGVAADGAAWSADAARALVAALRTLGPSSSRRLGAEVPQAAATLHLSVGRPYAGTQGAHGRVLQCLGFDGTVVRTEPTGSWTGGEYAWALMDDWLPGGLGGMAADAARAALMGRYLRRFGPVTTADARWWTGWTLTATTRALAAAGARPATTDAGPAWLAPDDTGDAPPPDPWCALLPSLDPTAMGWKDRRFTFGELGGLGGPLCDRNGNVGPTVWVDGAVVGGWGQRPDGTVALGYLTEVPAGRRRQVELAADRLTALLDGVVVKPRFPTALQRDLAAA